MRAWRVTNRLPEEGTAGAIGWFGFGFDLRLDTALRPGLFFAAPAKSATATKIANP